MECNIGDKGDIYLKIKVNEIFEVFRKTQISKSN